jgi:UDP-glucose 4-epimerase
LKWLITGGAGYIGSHVIEEFLKDGQEVIAYDSLVTGDPKRIQGICELIEGDIRNTDLVQKTLSAKKIEGIINLAALKSVAKSESMRDEYIDTNVKGVEILTELAVQAGVNYFIQSSTAAVYGESKNGYVSESDDQNPISTYAKTKIAAEIILKNKINSGKLLGVSLRYFNVAGSSKKSLIDKSKDNLIPMAIEAVRQQTELFIFGDNYETEDGTCVRDYLHVSDLAVAHLQAAKSLELKSIPMALNIGTGVGHSVRSVINEILRQSGSPLIPKVTNRRQGDPAFLVARVDLAKSELEFEATRSLTQIISSSFR